MVCVNLVIFKDVPLVLTSIWRCPCPSGITVQTPALPIIYPSILLSSDRPMDLFHRFDDKSDVILFTHSLEEGTGGSVVRSQ
jgi:hypothetical protein